MVNPTTYDGNIPPLWRAINLYMLVVRKKCIFRQKPKTGCSKIPPRAAEFFEMFMVFSGKFPGNWTIPGFSIVFPAEAWLAPDEHFFLVGFLK